MTATDPHRAIEAIFRIESARLVAGLTRIVRDVGLAEELMQDAHLAALERWPREGVPDNPGAWLMSTAKHRAIDLLRRSKLHQRKEDQLTREIEDQLEQASRVVARRGQATGRRYDKIKGVGTVHGPADSAGAEGSVQHKKKIEPNADRGFLKACIWCLERHIKDHL